MKIVVVGLGLIGGSLCKAIKARTAHTVYGIDTDADTLSAALECGAIDAVVTEPDDADLVFVCLHPKLTVEYILEHAASFKKGSIVADVCGVKRYIESRVAAPLAEQDVRYVGTHPMAGRQYSGFAYAVEDLFDRASFIITKVDTTDSDACATLSALAEQLGFTNIVETTAEIHDRIIAFTSQLAHVVSNAYIKSPEATSQYGFSAGSFRDLTRVAYLNADMWTELFMANREALSHEIETIIEHLSEYKQALDDEDADTLHDLLQTGSDRKLESIQSELKNREN